MSRPYRTAAFAVVLSSLITGIADAKAKPTPATPPTATVLQHGPDRNSDDAGRPAPPSTSEAFVISPEIRAKILAIEAAAATPAANADTKMWSAGSDDASASRVALAKTSASADSAVPKKIDTMHRLARGIISRTSSIAMSLTRSAMRFIGTPYVFGGTSPSGFDCSGYTQHVFAMIGVPLPRLADAQYYAGHKIVGSMATGDLVFFQTYEPGPSHVGIYVGGGKFIHSSSHGVMVSRLDNSYWRARYIGAKRIVALART